MNKTQSTVLFVSNDLMLCKASSSVLRTAGYRVRATTPVHVAEAMHQNRYAAAVLCATLTQQDSEQVVEKIQREQPEIPLLTLRVGLLGEAPHPASAFVVDMLRGAQALVVAVQSVTGAGGSKRQSVAS